MGQVRRTATVGGVPPPGPAAACEVAGRLAGWRTAHSSEDGLPPERGIRISGPLVSILGIMKAGKENHETRREAMRDYVGSLEYLNEYLELKADVLTKKLAERDAVIEELRDRGCDESCKELDPDACIPESTVFTLATLYDRIKVLNRRLCNCHTWSNPYGIASSEASLRLIHREAAGKG